MLKCPHIHSCACSANRIIINIVNQFNEFLRDAAKGNPNQPDSLQKLKADAGITLTLTNAEDPDAVGCFVMYRVAWYVAGDMAAVVNFFMLFDQYLQFKAKQLARATNFEVHIYPFTGVDLSSLEEQMSYTPIVHHDPSDTLPLKVFAAHPPMTKKILQFNFEPLGDETLNLVITGPAIYHVWVWRECIFACLPL